MAHLLPRVSLDSIDQASERDVARALVEQLNDEWMVYHSYPWLQNLARRRGALGEGEADFVILHPKFGLLVLEVKGGTLEFDSNTATWTQTGRTMKESPFQQARRNLHALLRQTGMDNLTPGSRTLPCPYGYAVAFPHCRCENRPPPGADPRVIIDADEMPRLGEKVQGALRAWAGENRISQMDPALSKKIKQAILSNFQLLPSLSRTLETEGEVLVKLTAEQTRVVESVAGNNRVGIEGVAGSGKTLLALHQARRWAEEGKRTLMLCYNRYLAEELQNRVKEGNLTIRHFHGWAIEVCKRTRTAYSLPTEPEQKQVFWNKELPELAAEALLEHSEEQFEAVIIDEAQDFRKAFWQTVDMMLDESDGPLFYFYDRSQALFQEEPDYPEAFRLTLSTNCRNTQAIAAACANVIQHKIDCHWAAPPGVVPSIELVKKTEEHQHKVESLLDGFLKQEKLSPSQIAILRPFKESPIPADHVGRHKLTGDLQQWHKGQAVWSSTIRAFKGLEADVLILIDVPNVGERHFDKSDLYVACSRACHRLHILTSSSSLKAHLTEAVGIAK
jgi:thymidine kinase